MITLYHGSYIQVGKPLVKLGRKKVDFGRGSPYPIAPTGFLMGKNYWDDALPTLSIYSFDYDAGERIRIIALKSSTVTTLVSNML